MYTFGQKLTRDMHFKDHIRYHVPVQIYNTRGEHENIGFIDSYTKYYIIMQGLRYNRRTLVFISRPGY